MRTIYADEHQSVQFWPTQYPLPVHPTIWLVVLHGPLHDRHRPPLLRSKLLPWECDKLEIMRTIYADEHLRVQFVPTHYRLPVHLTIWLVLPYCPLHDRHRPPHLRWKLFPGKCDKLEIMRTFYADEHLSVQFWPTQYPLPVHLTIWLVVPHGPLHDRHRPPHLRWKLLSGKCDKLEIMRTFYAEEHLIVQFWPTQYPLPVHLTIWLVVQHGPLHDCQWPPLLRWKLLPGKCDKLEIMRTIYADEHISVQFWPTQYPLPVHLTIWLVVPHGPLHDRHRPPLLRRKSLPGE